MSLEGRTEKRFSIAVALFLHEAEDGLPVEKTVTVNLSSRGAQVLSRRRWQPGTELRVVSHAGDLLPQSRVVYCHALQADSFSLGLEFRPVLPNWKDALA